MKFSILVPIYNVEKYLEQCLDSLIGQTFRDFEIVLIDDGSKDNSGKICDAYQKKYDDMDISVLHKKNEGLISARRAGIKIAQGEYCVFCDSDDYLEKNALEKLNNLLQKITDIDVILYNAYQVSEDKKDIFFENIFKEGIIEDKTEIIDKLLLTYEINSLCLKAVRTELIDKDKNYKELYACNYGEDLLQTMPIMLKAKKIYYLNETLYNYRVTSGMMKKYNANYYPSYKKVNNEISKLVSDSNLENYNEKISVHLLVAAYGAISQFKYLKSIDKIEIEKISNDKEFRNAYICVMNSQYKQNLNKKQRLLLKAVYTNQYFFIKILIGIAKIKNK